MELSLNLSSIPSIYLSGEPPNLRCLSRQHLLSETAGPWAPTRQALGHIEQTSNGFSSYYCASNPILHPI